MDIPYNGYLNYKMDMSYNRYLNYMNCLEYLKIAKHNYVNLPKSKEDIDYNCFYICDFDDTIYKNQIYMLESWENLYLPKKTRLTVLGVFGNIGCSSKIILFDNDGFIYTYFTETLIQISNSLNILLKEGVQDISKKYYFPHLEFKSTEEDETTDLNKNYLKFIKKFSLDFSRFLTNLYLSN